MQRHIPLNVNKYLENKITHARRHPKNDEALGKEHQVSVCVVGHQSHRPHELHLPQNTQSAPIPACNLPRNNFQLQLLLPPHGVAVRLSNEKKNNHIAT